MELWKPTCTGLTFSKNINIGWFYFHINFDFFRIIVENGIFLVRLIVM